MQGLAFPFVIHVPGTLTANITSMFKAPVGLSLLKVSAYSSADTNATLKIGTQDNDDAYLEAAAIANSGSPAEFDIGDFVSDQFPKVDAGDNVVFTLDFDGESGSAAADYTMVAYFAEG